ncbi:5-amino-6-(5-phospho-D-ribitylamino)uracil phosphatase, chloroplastic [Porphyridium purpureum]|uniref:5-amino-6-(5-phospho-D-ribitylamino)uracil phosphatase, chloroplastic n=1 Tax=Porphyridium purpureum TaxID=35688 RepID=A0A5J4Z5Z9_PORPP|nr:5-amino-6-(5-phospho-D-ribitylamino)uracil phosphatase, chloroplastic [Porphyridium purpureum]|eukprot:POR8015..scf295_1
MSGFVQGVSVESPLWWKRGCSGAALKACKACRRTANGSRRTAAVRDAHVEMTALARPGALSFDSRFAVVGRGVMRSKAGFAVAREQAWGRGRGQSLPAPVLHVFLPRNPGLSDGDDGEDESRLDKASLDRDLFWLDDNQDEYDDDGYLIRRAPSSDDEQAQEQAPQSTNDKGSHSSQTKAATAESESRPAIDRRRIISEVDLFREKELLFSDSKPTYDDSYRDREKKRSLSAFRGGRGGFIDVEEMNRTLTPDFLERHRFVLAPDEAFGAIFMWEAIVEGWRELEMGAWNAVATEESLYPVDMEDVIRAEDMIPEQAVQRVFHWTTDWGQIKKLIFRQREVLNEQLDSFEGFRVRDGVVPWLEALAKHGTRVCLCAPLPRQRVELILKKLDLRQCFPYMITADQEFESLEQMCLLAALTFERPPQKCAVFTDRPKGIIAAHEISMKAVAMVQAYKAFELRSADVTVSSFDQLVVLNVRRLFSEAGYERMDPQTQTEVQQLTMEEQR